MILYMGEELEVRMVRVPDFTGMNRQQATDAAGALGIYILAVGNDSLEPTVVAAEQSIAAGTLVSEGSTIEVRFADPNAAD